MKQSEKTNRWLLGADLHLGGSLSTRNALFARSWSRALASCADTIEKYGVRVFGVAGDVFDRTRLGGGEIDAWREFVDFCKSVGCAVVLIPGNHEIAGEGGGKCLPCSVNPFSLDVSDGLYEIEGFIVQGISSHDRQEIRDKVRQAKPCDLLMVHAAFDHLLGFESSCPISADDVPLGVKNVLAGDIHVVDGSQPIPSGGRVFSPGSFHATEIRELGTEYGAWMTCDPSDHTSYEWTPFFRQELVTFHIEDRPGAKNALEAIKPMAEDVTEELYGGEPLTVQLDYIPEASADVRYLVDSFRTDPRVRFRNRAVSDRTEEDDDEFEGDEEFIAGREQVSEALKQETDDEDVRVFLEDIVHGSGGEDTRDVLNNWALNQGLENVKL